MLDRFFPLYITVFAITLLITAIAEAYLIPRLSASAKQPIYKDGPSWHIAKSGTPTMGGLAFLLAVSLSLSLASAFLFMTERVEEAVSVITVTAFGVLNALVGIIDDLTKLRRKKNAGLSPKQKLFIQLILSALFLLARKIIFLDTTVLYFSFGKIDLGFFYYPIALLMLLGIINCANLTDGIDGLAASVAFSVAVSLFYISASLFTDSALIASAVIGASVGFLIFNINPAKIFMGDTGSLFFGAILVGAVFSLKNPLIMIFVGGVYVIEGISVVLQVLSYKLTKKRIFKMAPLHHHLERCGLGENKICMIAIIATFIMSIPAFIFYLP